VASRTFCQAGFFDLMCSLVQSFPARRHGLFPLLYYRAFPVAGFLMTISSPSSSLRSFLRHCHQSRLPFCQPQNWVAPELKNNLSFATVPECLQVPFDPVVDLCSREPIENSYLAGIIFSHPPGQVTISWLGSPGTPQCLPLAFISIPPFLCRPQRDVP
jgi:hypothetical protein